MKKRFKLSFRQIWLATGIFSLLLPVFLPSVAGSENFVQNTILLVNIAMFILSLPCSLFGVPVIAAAAHFLEMSPNSIEGMYLNTVLFFILGFVQWFWIARFWSPTGTELQMLGLAGENPELRLLEVNAINNIPACDAEGRTRLEKVFQERDAG